MNKVELLAPVGNKESLYAAVQNGCDAVYLAGIRFGARAFANNFSNNEMIEAIEYCHQYGVKVYVTMNTLIYEDEMDDVIDYIRFLYNNDVDAIIVQDLGIVEVSKQLFPDLELHASTQMHIHNVEGAKWISQNGVHRVVMARETPLSIITEVTKNHHIEVEVFVQGALCVCYSGQCLMSSVIGNRSGNRGECAQPCRLPYALYKESERVEIEGEYLLSSKDLYALEDIDALIESGIHSFKIEGRMKRPEYVGYMVSLYRKAIDSYYNKQIFKIEEDEKEKALKLFNRGYTRGYLFNQFGTQFIQTYRGNHVGIEIGRVIKVTKDRCDVLLSKPIAQHDGVRFLNKEDEGFQANFIYQNGLLVNGANANEVITLEKKGYIEIDTPLVKTSDSKELIDIQSTYQTIRRKVLVKVKVIAKIGLPLHIQLEDEDGYNLSVEGSVVQEALSSPIDENRIQEQISKMQDTIFKIEEYCIDKDKNIFISIKEINVLRRQMLDQLVNMRKKRYGQRKIGTYARVLDPIKKVDSYHQVVVSSKEQMELCLKYSFDHIFCETKALLEEYKENKKIGFLSNRINELSYYPKQEIALIGEIGAIPHYEYFIADYSFNCTNSYALAFLFAHRAQQIVLSLELEDVQINAMIQAFIQRYHYEPNIIKRVYGYKEMMVSKHCIVHTHYLNQDKKNCSLCKLNKYYLKDRKGHSYRLLADVNCNMRIFESKPTQDNTNIFINKQYYFSLENTIEVENILKKMKF